MRGVRLSIRKREGTMIPRPDTHQESSAEAVTNRAAAADRTLPRRYRRACRLAEQGRHGAARRLYEQVAAETPALWLQALVANDLAVIAVAEEDADAARRALQAALVVDPECQGANQCQFELWRKNKHT
jgi:tetratricopeptide (TPR) repeat protein